MRAITKKNGFSLLCRLRAEWCWRRGQCLPGQIREIERALIAPYEASEIDTVKSGPTYLFLDQLLRSYPSFPAMKAHFVHIRIICFMIEFHAVKANQRA
jgi:hypothetical protein